MARLPYQVLVILYLQSENHIKYCIFERKSPRGQLQFVAGGGEDDETPLQAAMREVHEEAGINKAIFQQLTSVCYIPTNIFSQSQRQAWGENVFVIPEHAFGAKVETENVSISDEHVAFNWVSYDEAMAQLAWDSNKTALYELNCRLKNP
ncbi:MAG: NUDIX pyrophosphatase [Oscillospiraceae bacterium]|nr:NUDIX pyrophosphatase [Oscillospiraceae bacterium]